MTDQSSQQQNPSVPATPEPQSKLKTITDALPLGTVLILILSFVCLTCFYSYYNIEPFSYFELTDLSKYLMNNVVSIIILFIESLFKVAIPFLIYWYYKQDYLEPIKFKIKNLVLIWNDKNLWTIFMSAIIVTFYLSKLIFKIYTFSPNLFVFNLGNESYSIYFLKWLYTCLFTLSGGLILYRIFIENELKLSFIKPFLILMIIYLPIESFFNAKALRNNKYNRNICLIAKEKKNMILPFDENKFVIGSTSGVYLCYNIKSQLVEIIKKEDIIKVMVFDKIKLKPDYKKIAMAYNPPLPNVFDFSQFYYK